MACSRVKRAPPTPGPPQVGYVVVQPQAVELKTELPGRTAAYLTSDVRPQVNGIVKARLTKAPTFGRAPCCIVLVLTAVSMPVDFFSGST